MVMYVDMSQKKIDIPDRVLPTPKPDYPKLTEVDLGPISVDETISYSEDLGFLTIFGNGTLVEGATVIKSGTKIIYTDSMGAKTQLNLIASGTGKPILTRFFNDHIQIFVNTAFQNLVGSRTLSDLIGSAAQSTVVETVIFVEPDKLAKRVLLTKNKVIGLDSIEYSLNGYGEPGVKYTIESPLYQLRVPGYSIKSMTESTGTLSVGSLIIMYSDLSSSLVRITKESDGSYFIIKNLPVSAVKKGSNTYVLLNGSIPLGSVLMTEATMLAYDPTIDFSPVFSTLNEKKAFFDALTLVAVPSRPAVPNLPVKKPDSISDSDWASLSILEQKYLMGVPKESVILTVKIFKDGIPGIAKNVWDSLSPEQKIESYNNGSLEIIAPLGPSLNPQLPNGPNKSGSSNGNGYQDHSKLSNMQSYLLTHPNRGQSSVITQVPTFAPRNLEIVDTSMLHSKSELSILQKWGVPIIASMIAGIGYAYYAKYKDQFALDPFQKEVLDIEKADRALATGSNNMQTDAINKYQAGVAGLKVADALSHEEEQTHGILGQALRRAGRNVVNESADIYATKLTNKLTGRKSEEEKALLDRANAREDAKFGSELRVSEAGSLKGLEAPLEDKRFGQSIEMANLAAERKAAEEDAKHKRSLEMANVSEEKALLAEERRHKLAQEAAENAANRYEGRLTRTAERNEAIERRRRLEKSGITDIPGATVDDLLDLKEENELERQEKRDLRDTKELEDLVRVPREPEIEVPKEDLMNFEPEYPATDNELPKSRYNDLRERSFDSEYPEVPINALDTERNTLEPEDRIDIDSVRPKRTPKIVDATKNLIAKYGSKKIKTIDNRKKMTDTIDSYIRRSKEAGASPKEINELVNLYNYERMSMYGLGPVRSSDY